MANAKLQALLQKPAAVAATARSAPQQDSSEFAYDEEPRSLLTQVTGPVIGAVGAVGNLLDLPGSMLRDTLTLNNPFDQLLTPFSAENRIDGRQMLNTWGLASENKETGIGGWLDDPMEGVQDVGGFIAEMAFDPLNFLTAPAKAAVSGRGLLQNISDPLRMAEAGQAMGLRSKLANGATRTKNTVTKLADTLEKSKHFGESFGAARKLAKTTATEIDLAARSMFESAVGGTHKALSQGLMRTLNTTKALRDDAIKANALGIHRRLAQGLQNAHGEDFLSKLDEGTVEVTNRAMEAAGLGDALADPIREKLASVGFSEDQITEKLTNLQAITRNTDTLGSQFPELQEFMKDVESTHLDNAGSRVPSPANNELFKQWKATGNRPSKDMYSELGWEVRSGSTEVYNADLGMTVARLSDKGGWNVFQEVDGKMEAIQSFGTKSGAIEAAHNIGQTAARDAAGFDFDDMDDYLKQFVDHDRNTLDMMKDTLGESSAPNFMSLREEIRAAAEGARHNFRWLTPELQEIAKELRVPTDRIQSLQDRGFITAPWTDDAIEVYIPRRQGETVKAEFKNARGEGEGAFEGGLQQVINAASPSTTHRDEAYINWRTGTAGINGYFRDPELAETLNSVRKEFFAGELKGKVTPKQVGRIRETLSGISVGEETAEKFFDDLVKDGLINMQDLDTTIMGVAKKIGQQAAGVVKRADGKSTKSWVVGGQGRGYHMLDSMLSTDAEGTFLTHQVRRNKEMPNQLGDLAPGLESASYDEAVEFLDGHNYRHLKADQQRMQREVAKSGIRDAQKDGIEIFVRRNPDGTINDLFRPQTGDTVQKRLMTQLRNLGKKFDGSSQLDESDLLELQKARASEFTHKKYGGEDGDIIDAMPRRDDYGRRVGKDYRDGRTGNDLSMGEDDYAKLQEKSLVTDDLEKAINEGLVHEVVDSRIDDAIIPKIFHADGGYSAHNKMGVFTNDPLFDQIEGSIRLSDTELRADVFERFVESFIKKGDSYDNLVDPAADTADNTIETLLDSQRTGVNANKFLEHIVKKRTAGLEGEALTAEVARLKKIQISSADWNDLAKGLDPNKSSLIDMPGLQSAVKFTDAMTRMFKVGVLAWPARIARDFTSALIRSAESGMVDLNNPAKAMNSLKLGNAVATGRHTAGFKELLDSSPGFREAFQLSQHSRLVGTADEVTAGTKKSLDEAVFNYFQDTFFMRQGGAYLHTDMDMSDVIADGAKAGSLEPIKEAIPNFDGNPLRENAKALASDIRSDGASALNPANIQGLPQYLTNDPKLKGQPRKKSKFFADRIAGHAGQYTDSVTRSTAVIDQMRNGVSFEDALTRAKSTLVDYDPRRFSNVERDVLKRVFPFYSFLSSQVPYVMKELATNPTGGLGATVRAQRHAQDDEYVPYHMRDKAAIPLGQDEQGNQHYIESLGLMHEDAVAMLKPDLADVFGKMNPLLKAPVELATGRSLFMRGPTGGRELSEMDPAVGRIIQSAGEVTGLLEPTDARPVSPIGATGEHLLSNSPAARLLSTTRTMLDSRKTIGQKTASLLTGVKVSTISPESQQSMLRSELDAILKAEGVRPFSRYSLRKDDIQDIEESGNKELAYKLKAVEKVRAILDKARKEKVGN